MLPARIIYTVWSGDRSGWTDTRDAIARNLVQLGDDWRLHYVPDSAIIKQARYLGILLVLLSFVILVIFDKELPVVISIRLPNFDNTSIALVILGWGIVAVGAFSILADLIDPFFLVAGPSSGQSAILNIALGAVAAAACGLLHRATKAFEVG